MIKIICVGKIKEKYFIDAIAEYKKRLGKYTSFDVVELPDYNYDISKTIYEAVKNKNRDNTFSVKSLLIEMIIQLVLFSVLAVINASLSVGLENIITI